MKVNAQWTWMVAGIVAVAIAGCGSDSGGGDGGGDGNYGDPLPATETEKMTATTAVDNVATLAEIEPTAADNTEAIGSISANGGVLQTLVASKQKYEVTGAGSGAGSGLPSGMGNLPGALSAVQGALTEGCVTTANNTITYTNCSDEANTFTIDGTIAIEGGTYTIDLTTTFNTAGASGGTHQEGSLAVSPTAISGKISYEFNVDTSGGLPGGSEAPAVSAQSNIEAWYDIVLDGAGCATGGTLEVKQTTTASVEGLGDLGGLAGGAGAGSTDIWVKAEFGPACGDVTLY